MSVISRNSIAMADPRAFTEADGAALATGPRMKSEADGQAIYDTLRGLIVEGGMSPGSRLPTERALADRFLAARNTVRKTMNRLVHERLVVRHVGRGTFVAETPPQPKPAAEEAEFGVSELLEARLLFEPGMAELVVERASDEDLLVLSSHLEALRRAETWKEFKEAKYALHLAIARASKNRFLVQMFERIVASRRRAAWDRPGGHRLPVSAVLEHAIADNAAIVDALCRRDGGVARDLIRANLTRTLLSVGDS
jgi:GntR family transcriptional repressor for pyruvate dehydrogenase complex